MSIVHGNPRDDLKHVRTRDEAARLHDDLVETIDHDRRQPGAGGRVRELNQVLNELEDDWDLVGKVFGEDGHGKPRRGGLGPTGKRFKGSGRATTRSGKNRPKQPSPTRPRPAGRGRKRAFAGGYLLGRRRALEATRLPGAVRTTSANVLYALGAIIFLAIVYDVLSAGKAPSLFLNSVTGFLDRLVGLKDPLAPLAGNVEQGVHLSDTVNAGVGAVSSGVANAAPTGIGPSVASGVGAVRSGVTGLHVPAHAPPGFPAIRIPKHTSGLGPLANVTADVVGNVSGHLSGTKIRRFAHPNRPANRPRRR